MRFATSALVLCAFLGLATEARAGPGSAAGASAEPAPAQRQSGQSESAVPPPTKVATGFPVAPGNLRTFKQRPDLVPIGSAVTVEALVTAALASDTRRLRDGDYVHQNETVEVSDDGRGELKFNDDTKVALGPGSRLVLDNFVYDAERRSGSIILNLVQGTFRFITGLAAKPTYLIRTPNANITVRGTIFDLYVMRNGTVWALLIEGGIDVCNAQGTCRRLDEPGKLMRVTDEGDVGIPVKWVGLPGHGNISFETAFPFIERPPQLDPTPILTRDVVVLGRLPKPEALPQPPDHDGKDGGGTGDDVRPGRMRWPDWMPRPKLSPPSHAGDHASERLEDIKTDVRRVVDVIPKTSFEPPYHDRGSGERLRDKLQSKLELPYHDGDSGERLRDKLKSKLDGDGLKERLFKKPDLSSAGDKFKRVLRADKIFKLKPHRGLGGLFWRH